VATALREVSKSVWTVIWLGEWVSGRCKESKCEIKRGREIKGDRKEEIMNE
jgi:hypothetical protein